MEGLDCLLMTDLTPKSAMMRMGKIALDRLCPSYVWNYP